MNALDVRLLAAAELLMLNGDGSTDAGRSQNLMMAALAAAIGAAGTTGPLRATESGNNSQQPPTPTIFSIPQMTSLMNGAGGPTSGLLTTAEQLQLVLAAAGSQQHQQQQQQKTTPDVEAAEMLLTLKRPHPSLSTVADFDNLFGAVAPPDARRARQHQLSASPSQATEIGGHPDENAVYNVAAAAAVAAAAVSAASTSSHHQQQQQQHNNNNSGAMNGGSTSSSSSSANGQNHGSQRPSVPSSTALLPTPAASSLPGVLAGDPGFSGAFSSERMRYYLANRDKLTCVLSIYHAKVAQKSYGNEKRFFSPPPCVYIHGSGWASKKVDLIRHAGQCGEAMRADSAELVVTIGIANAPAEFEHFHALDFHQDKPFCAARQLFVSDQDKRKYFELRVNVSHASGHPVGAFTSQRIKVISKPSKKKQSIKSTDCRYLCISSGTKIALFNRLRSQTVSTRYLNVAVPKAHSDINDSGISHPQFVVSSNNWGAFTIHLVDDPNDQFPGDQTNGGADVTRFLTKDGWINYGSIIRLVDHHSNISLPNLRICKVDKTSVTPAGGNGTEQEPVSQLHKVAFEFADTPGQFLCLIQDKIISQTAQREARGPNPAFYSCHLQEGAIWTIISTDNVEYRWWEALGPTRAPVTPHPFVTGLNVTEPAPGSRRARLEIAGTNFKPGLQVWLGCEPLDTQFKGDDELVALLPDDWSGRALDAAADSLHPLLLVRPDGVVYPTQTDFR